MANLANEADLCQVCHARQVVALPSDLADVCPSCGAELHPLADLTKLATQISTRSGHALHALENRRIAVPSVVPVALQEAHLDGRILAARLACHAGTCAVPAPAPSPASLLAAAGPTSTTPASPSASRKDVPRG